MAIVCVGIAYLYNAKIETMERETACILKKYGNELLWTKRIQLWLFGFYFSGVDYWL